MKNIHALQSCLPYFSGNEMARARESVFWLLHKGIPKWVAKTCGIKSLSQEKVRDDLISHALPTNVSIFESLYKHTVSILVQECRCQFIL